MAIQLGTWSSETLAVQDCFEHQQGWPCLKAKKATAYKGLWKEPKGFAILKHLYSPTHTPICLESLLLGKELCLQKCPHRQIYVGKGPQLCIKLPNSIAWPWEISSLFWASVSSRYCRKRKLYGIILKAPSDYKILCYYNPSQIQKLLCRSYHVIHPN
jgi:hypothetical protein